MLIHVKMPRNPSTEVIHSTDVKVPVLPPIGSYLSHDAFNICGYVEKIDFWWNEQSELHISIQLK